MPSNYAYLLIEHTYDPLLPIEMQDILHNNPSSLAKLQQEYEFKAPEITHANILCLRWLADSHLFHPERNREYYDYLHEFDKNVRIIFQSDEDFERSKYYEDTYLCQIRWHILANSEVDKIAEFVKLFESNDHKNKIKPNLERMMQHIDPAKVAKNPCFVHLKNLDLI